MYFLLLAFELLNTSIEKLSDKISEEFPMRENAKKTVIEKTDFGFPKIQ